MTTPSPRFDMYTIIHKALRAWTAEVAGELGRLDAEDNAACSQTFAQVREWLEHMHAHLTHEDDFIHAALAARGRTPTRDIAAQHDEHRAALDLLGDYVNAAQSATGPARRAAVTALYRALWLFTADTLVHMHSEETEQQSDLERVFNDLELIEIHDRLVASIPPETMGRLLQKILPAISPYERAGMLAGMQQSAPPPAFEGALAIARASLSSRDMDKLMAAIAPLPLAA